MTRQTFFQRLLAILVFVLFTNLFFFHDTGPVAFGLLAMGFFFFLVFIFSDANRFTKNLARLTPFFFALTFFLSGLLLRANPFILAILVLAVLGLLSMEAYLLSSQIPMVRSLFEFILAPLYFAGSYIKHGFKMLGFFASDDYKKIVAEKEEGPHIKNTWIRSTIIGLLIGIFIVSILISMFSGADPIFAQFVRNILSADFLRDLPYRIFWSMMIAALLLPFIFIKRKNTFNSPVEFFQRINFVQEMTVIMVLVAAVVGIFLIVQWPYVFANVPFETDLSKFGVATYSEYVRKGFGELLKIALFVYGLIWAGLIIMRKNKTPAKKILRYVQFVVVGEFFIFLISIFRRVWLYQSYHGWSLIRIYGSFFLFWIMGITVFLALRHFAEKRFVVGEMIFTAFILSFIGVFNVEHFVATNHPPTVNKRVDYVYLSRLSPDGYAGWEKAFAYAKGEIDKYTAPTSRALEVSGDERRNIAYAGIIVRELLGNYKYLVREYGTSAEMKDFLVTTYDYKSKMLSKRFLSNDNLTQKEMIEKNLKLIKEGGQDYRQLIDRITIPKDYFKYKFDTGTSLISGEDSFVEIPYYIGLNTDTKGVETKDYTIDRLYNWNASMVGAYENMKQNMPYTKLLELDEKYFDLYQRIMSRPPNERGYEMDISLDSPLLE